MAYAATRGREREGEREGEREREREKKNVSSAEFANTRLFEGERGMAEGVTVCVWCVCRMWIGRGGK